MSALTRLSTTNGVTMPYVNGYNLSGYSPDPEHLHIFATVADAREDHADTLRRWEDDCWEAMPAETDPEHEDMVAIAAELAATAEIVGEWIHDDGGAIGTRGPDGNEYTFWTVAKTLAELRADGWSAEDVAEIVSDEIATRADEIAQESGCELWIALERASFEAGHNLL